MYKICVFAGTTEGRRLIEFLAAQPACVTACVATEYGEALLEPSENLTVLSRRLTADEMTQFFKENAFELVIDATHPYAAAVTENIRHACGLAGTEYLRLARKDSEISADAVCVPDVTAAVEFLNSTEGNILLTTGSKEINKFAGLNGFSERVHARVLPMIDSLEACRAVGLQPDHIIAMQGPFTEEMNEAMARFVSAKWLVTKDGGDAGGFDSKAAAAQKAGARILVIGRPAQVEGFSLADTIEQLCSRFGFVRKPCVSIVGIGPGSRDSMTVAARRAIEKADCLIGAKRMLHAVASSGKKLYDAIAPNDIAAFIRDHGEYRRFTVVLSGDVGFYSGAKKLLPLLSDCEVEVQPGVSSLVYLCARLKTSYEDVVTASVHGREENIVPVVKGNPRVFVLVGGEGGMADLCRSLIDAGLGDVKLHIGERLSYSDERITSGTARELACGVYDALCVALIENEKAGAVVTHGLPDEAFLRGNGEDGIVPMTKSEVRSVCLSKLRLTDRAVCWDIGAGTGSVAIEMAIQAKNGHVFAVERNEAALSLIEKNKERLGIRNLTVVNGYAPDACRDLPAPTHVFIGGSNGNMREILALLLEKNPNVRIVATAVTLESIAELADCMKEYPFTETETVSMTIARDRKLGAYHLMTGRNPVYIYTLQAGDAAGG